MAYSNYLSVAPRYSWDQLLEKVSGFVFWKTPSFDDTIKQLPASGIFHRDCKMGGRQEDFIELYYVRVAWELPMVDDFTLYIFVYLQDVQSDAKSSRGEWMAETGYW